MVKEVCFSPIKAKKPLKIKDFCVKVQNCCTIMAPPCWARTSVRVAHCDIRFSRADAWLNREFTLRAQHPHRKRTVNVANHDDDPVQVRREKRTKEQTHECVSALLLCL